MVLVQEVQTAAYGGLDWLPFSTDVKIRNIFIGFACSLRAVLFKIFGRPDILRPRVENKLLPACEFDKPSKILSHFGSFFFH
jgi:hypothetical protein